MRIDIDLIEFQIEELNNQLSDIEHERRKLIDQIDALELSRWKVDYPVSEK